MPAFGFSLLPYRIDHVLIWLFGSLFIILVLTVCRRHLLGRGIRLICGLLALTFFILYLSPSSVVSYDRRNRDSTVGDRLYYATDNGRFERPDFTVQAVDLSLSIGRIVRARAVLTVSPADLTQYRLTLYHGYRVSGVETDEGKTLPFTQEGDYLTVDNAEQDPVRSLVIDYGGPSNQFYATIQSTYLPGYFAYYPRAGFFPLYDEEQEFIRNIEPSAIAFTVQVDSPIPLICNLPKVDTNAFAGTSNGLTLVSGFYRELDVDGVRLVYPYLDNKGSAAPDDIAQNWRNAKSKLAIDDSVRSVFIGAALRGRSVNERISQYADHLVIQAFAELEEFYDEQKLPAEKQTLYSFLEEDKKGSGNIELMALSFTWQPNWREVIVDPDQLMPTTSTAFLLHDLFWLKGKEPVVAACERFLDDMTDTRSGDMFLQTLYEALPDLTPEQQQIRDKDDLRRLLAERAGNPVPFDSFVGMVRAQAEGTDGFEQMERWQKEHAVFLLTFDLRLLLQEAIDTRGEEEALASINRYLESPDSSMSVRDYLIDLADGGDLHD